MGKIEKIIGAGKELLGKTMPVAEAIKRKSIENVPKLIEFCKGVMEKVSEKAGELVESGRKSYESIRSRTGADSEMVEKVEKEIGTSQKLKEIGKKSMFLARETIRKIFDVIKKRMPNEIGAIGDIESLKKKMGMDVEVAQGTQGEVHGIQGEGQARKKEMNQGNEHQINSGPNNFRERVDAANARELEEFQNLSSEEQGKIEPFKLPLAVRKERDRQQMEKELKDIAEGSWTPEQSEYGNPKKWLGMDQETASKRLHDLEVADLRAFSGDTRVKNNISVPEKPSILKRIKEEGEGKKQQKQEEVAKIFKAETELARRGEWDRFKSDLTRHSYRGVIDDLETLEKINKGVMKKKKKEEEENKIREIKDAYQKEKKLAEAGEWNEFKSYLGEGRISDNYGEAEMWKELYDTNQEAKKKIEAEKDKERRERYPSEYVREAALAQKGEWDPWKSFFFGVSDKEAFSRWEELFRINGEFKRSKRSKRGEARSGFNGVQQEEMEDQALQALNLQREGLDEKSLQRAFRHFSLKFHPDKLESQGLTEEARKEMLKQFQAVSSGWDSLMRKIKEGRKV